MATSFLLLCLATVFGLSSGVVLSCDGSCSCNLTTGTINNCSDVTDFPDTFPNASSIQELYIVGNNITVLNSKLHIFESLKQFVITSSGVEIIQNNTFRGMGKLQHISLTRNSIVFIRHGTFADLPELQGLVLSHNDISTLDAHSVWNMSNLIDIDLSYNKITHLFSASFGPLPSVTILDLGYNRLRFVTDIALKNFPSLTNLVLTGNRIKTLNAFDFAHCSSLKSLHLSNNQINIISDKAFLSNATGKGLKINQLYLENNQLTEFPPLNDLNRLLSLLISRNSIDSIPSDAMIGLSGLRYFHMTYDRALSDIEPGVFRKSKSLINVLLNDNPRLKNLPDGLFANQKLLHTLFLGNCSLTAFPESLGSWENLKFLSIVNNSFHCDCSMKWLSKPHYWNRSWKTADLMCASPPELDNRSVLELDDSVLPCVDHTAVSNRVRNGIIFAIVTIVLIAIVALVIRFRRTVVLRWRYYRYARQTDDVPFTVDNEYSDYPSGKRKLRMSDLERDT
ncbi:leucine-rich repeat-containing protein 15-like [Argopecten irradians]|uniref:leucine-rich repeat-containing protein 15-like n=1 Tax=Argopecten irradians TaxID=31199 RepID=UPI0037230478